MPAAPKSQRAESSGTDAATALHLPDRGGSLSAWCRRHAVFLAALLVGAFLRVVVQQSFTSPLVLGGGLTHWQPVVVAAQHLLGLATGTVIYVLLLRWGVARWLAAVATVPVLWDSYRLASAQMVAPDTIVAFLVAVALLVLCWRARWKSRVTAALVVIVGVSLAVAPFASEPAGYTGVTSDAEALMGYQDFGYVPGPILLACLPLALLAAAGAGRARGSGMRTVCLLLAAGPVGVLLQASAAGEHSWRHQLSGLVLLPAAGALGLTALLRGRRAPASSRSQIDDVDRAALADFHQRYGAPVLGPVVVIIAAYNEGEGIPGVLSSMPSTVCGLSTDVVVVDDGSTDGTAGAVRTSRATYSVACHRNRGQGAALRLGYRVARTHGARYIITTDADGQYDVADFPVVLSPVLEESADFVTGSRRLGRQHAHDRFRRAGVYVFAWIASALTGQRLTDTSFGLRAMRAEVTAAVTLNQPQYQSAELLIGALSHGYRIAEVPGTMHLRTAGTTKKGGNLVYGTRYARVVLGTWWREGCPTPTTERAPALLGQQPRAPGAQSP